MSQNKTDFQPKHRSGGQKFGGKKPGGAGRGRPEGRGFGKKFEGDRDSKPRPRRDFGDRPPRGDRDDTRRERPAFRSDGDSRGGFGGKRSYGDRDDKPRRDFGDRPKRDFGDRPKRDFGDRPKRDFGAKRDFSDRPKRDFGDRPKRDFGDRPKRDFGAKRDFSDRPKRDFSDRPKRDFGDRPKRDFGDRPQRDFGAKRDFSDRPKRDFGDRPKRDFGGKGKGNSFKNNDRRPQRSYTRYEDDRSGGVAAQEPASYETRQKLNADRPNYGTPSSAFLFGVHPVTEAILNPKRLHQRLLCTQKGYESIQEACQRAQEAGLHVPDVIWIEKEDMERLLPRDAVHQGVLLDCQPLEEIFLADIINAAPENAKIVVLDQVTDPHNVGAILRSAAAFGATAVVVQRQHAPDVTGTLAKSASGAVEHVPFVREVNLSRALQELREAGFMCIGFDEEGKETIATQDIKGKVALVFGAEGAGLRRLVAENCDTLVKLPTQGRIASLNVSNAVAVALYEAVRA